MLRALETSQLISKELSDLNLPIKSDVLLCEGKFFFPLKKLKIKIKLYN